MKTVLALLAAVLVVVTPAQAQPRVYSQPELDALLAPVALHPDGLLSQILIAATYPQDVAAAAAWSRSYPHLQGDDAVRAVQYEPWDPAVKALVAFPDLLARMAESPQWLHELGEAFLVQEPQVMDTVQGLRRRAQASGHLNGGENAVYQQGDAIVVQPPAQVIYVRYYDPYVVYGPWWWAHYRPVFWRPWIARPVHFSHGFFYSAPDWRHRHVRVVHAPVHVHHHTHHVAPGKWQHVNRAVPEARRQPIIRNTPAMTPPSKAPHATPKAPPQVNNRQPVVKQHMPAANGFSGKAPHVIRQPQHQEKRQQQQQRREQRREAHQNRGPRG